MNPWLGALLGIIIGAILMFGVTRFKERRGGRRWLSHEALLEEEKRKHLANFEDFDIDYNQVAYSKPDPDMPPKLRYKPSTTFLDLPTDTELSLGLVDERLLEKNKRAYEEETELALGITREARGYGIMTGQCNNLNLDESYPYYCVRHKSHIHHVDPKVRRHGYAGVFWD